MSKTKLKDSIIHNELIDFKDSLAGNKSVSLFLSYSRPGNLQAAINQQRNHLDYSQTMFNQFIALFQHTCNSLSKMSHCRYFQLYVAPKGPFTL